MSESAADAKGPEATASEEWSFDALAKVGAIGAGLSALALLIGYALEQAYFSALGLNWYLPSLSSTSIIQQGVVFLGVVATSAFLSTAWLASGRSNKVVDRRAMYVGLLSLPLLLGPEFAGHWLSFRAAYLCTAVGAIALVASAGITLGIILHQTRGQQSRWRSLHTGNLAWVYLAVAVWCPPRIGETQAAYNLDSTSSDLPRVVAISPPATPGDMRLVHLEGDTALVVLLSGRPTFQIIKLGPGFMVESTKFLAPSSAASSGVALPSVPAAKPSASSANILPMPNRLPSIGAASRSP
jgi:hypothetical protein